MLKDGSGDYNYKQDAIDAMHCISFSANNIGCKEYYIK